MSRPSHLPPRCPLQNKSSPKDEELRSKLLRFPSQGSYFEEQPEWLDELLTDSCASPKGILHRRSASDSIAILEAPTNLNCQIPAAGEGNALSPVAVHVSPESVEGKKSGSILEASCVYGPNSPRQRSQLSNSESEIVTALMENAPRNALQYVGMDFPNGYGVSEFDVRGNFQVATDDLDPEKAARRRSGQRSRVRKLQYIAELERTVEVFQTYGAELAAGVASLFQQRLALSAENKKLRRQIASLRREKMIKDGQYQSLKNEADRLKIICGRHRRTRSAASCFEMGTAEIDPSPTSWQTLDLGKLSLGGTPVTLSHGFGR